MTNLQLLRIARGMSQSELADRLGMRPCDLSKLENRWYAKINNRVFSNIKKVFGPGWTFDALMQQVAEPTPPGQTDELRKAS